jgi:hypothetical protein
MKLIFLIIVVAAYCFWHFSRKKASSQIPFDKKPNYSNDEKQISYDNLDDWKADLKILWQGSALEIEFTYQSRTGKKRRKVALRKVAKSPRNDLYLIGVCHERNEDRTFNMDNITTMILYKSKRYSHYDFLSEVVGIDATGYSFTC